jgi:starch synthase
VPVVARTGGLADTVVDANLAAMKAGRPPASSLRRSLQGLAQAISRAIALYADAPAWRAVQKAGMRLIFRGARAAPPMPTSIVN